MLKEEQDDDPKSYASYLSSKWSDFHHHFLFILAARMIFKNEEIGNILTKWTRCSPPSIWHFLIHFFRGQRTSCLNISFYWALLWFWCLLYSMKIFHVIMQQLGFAEWFWTVQELASKLVISVNSCSFWCNKIICSLKSFCYCKNKTNKFPPCLCYIYKMIIWI